MKASYPVYMKGHWQYTLSTLPEAQKTAKGLADHTQKPVDIYKRFGSSISFDEFVETVKPVGFGGVK